MSVTDVPPTAPPPGWPIDDDYPQSTKVAAALLTLFAPFISLVVALVLRSSETKPKRRASLQTWAVASGAWLALGLVIGLIAIASVMHTVAGVHPSDRGPCQGGPQMNASGTPLGNGRYRFPCEFGGSTVVRFNH
jgi:hypothetical protein